MSEAVDMGMNRTGSDLRPGKSKEAKAAAQNFSPDHISRVNEMAEMRKTAIQEADPVGTVPPPGTLKGVAKTGLKIIQGKNATTFVDKLGERLAFERSGFRLYQALIEKVEAKAGTDLDRTLDRLRHFQTEEANHFFMLMDCFKKIGADPSAMTPSADLGGVASEGLLQIITDPRTSVPACMQALLTAEMVDNAGWELLIELADDMGDDEMVLLFTDALREEKEHLEGIKSLYTSLIKEEDPTIMDTLH